MKAPLQNSRGRMRYTGRLARTPFNAWAASPDGLAVLERVASKIQFTLLGRMRSARRRVWRQMVEAARREGVVAAVRREADEYLRRLDPIVYAQDLPRLSVDLHRLIVVPRLFLDAEAYRGLYVALRSEPAVAALEVESLHEWFVLTIVAEMERAVAAAQPSTRHPLPLSSDWTVVGVNELYEWRVPFEGPPWPGHYYLLEITSSPMTRALRKAADEGIASLERSLPSLTRARRNEILRQAGLSLDQLIGESRGRAVSF